MNDLPELDRDVTPVARQRKLFRTLAAQRLGFAAAGLCAVGFFGFGVYSMVNDKGPKTKPVDTGSTTIAQTVPNPTPLPPKAQEPAAKPVEAPAPQIVYINAPATQTAAAPQTTAYVPDNLVRFPASSGETFFDTSKPDSDKAAGNSSAGPSSKDVPVVTQVAFKPSTIAGGRAGPAMRLTYLMMPQHIPCALNNAMDSTLAGSISCHTTQDVRSPEKVLLMPAGTPVMGTYKNEIRNGQHRLFSFTGNAFTPEGIPVPLDSAVADSLGRSGIEGDVDNHYMERFGAAIALTAAQSAMSIAQASVSKGGNTNFSFSSGGGAENIANEILRSQIGIPPTISVPPGTVITIVVDHPIDFSDAIRVESRR